MFKPVPFEPTGYRRQRRGLPRWLTLLLTGLCAGAGGVLYVQAYHLPPRLSIEAGEHLRNALTQAQTENRRLTTDLADTKRQLGEATEQKNVALADHTGARETIEQLQRDVQTLVEALPPDPRGGNVSVRGGDLRLRNGQLDWMLVLSRAARPGAAPLPGVLQLTVTGQTETGTERSVTLDPVPLQLAVHQVLRGRAALPADFHPRQTTIQVLDRAGGTALGRRVLLVQQ